MRKNPVVRRALALVLASILLIPAAIAASGPASAAGSGDSFYKALAQLLQEDDTSAYFDTMELSIGSSVLTVDGETRQMNAAPEAQGQRTMLPIRPIAEAAGAEVSYDAGTNSAVITSASGDEIQFPIGSNEMTVNNRVTTLDVASYASNGRTYLPVRAVAEALDMEVEWSQATSTVTLTAPYQSRRILAWSDSRLDAGGLGAKTAITDGKGFWVLQFGSPSQAKAAAEALNDRGVTAEPDNYITFAQPSSQAGTAAAQGHNSWGAVDCHFDAFLNTYSGQLQGSGVVAVLDTGVDSTHPYLKGRVLSGWNCVNGNSNTADIEEHGTHVAATIIDCAGSAPVKILPVRVFQRNSQKKLEAWDSAIYSGIIYAVDHGADVINLSLGGPDSELEHRAVAYALEHGTLVVAAAGNDNINTANVCPAHITTPGVVVVSAGDSSHQRAIFENGASNYGSSVDLMAPGKGIYAAVPGTYRYMDGTSMAAPHVSAAAVLIDLATGKSLSPAALETAVRSATTGKGVWQNQQAGCGFLDLSNANLSAVTVKPEISLSRRAVSLKPGESITLTASTVPSGTSVSWSSSDTGVVRVWSGGAITAVGPGEATVKAKMTYGGKNYSVSCFVSVADTLKPEISLSQSSLSLKAGESKTLTASVTPSGTAVSWSSSDTGVAAVRGGTVTALGQGSAVITAKITCEGKSYQATCTVSVSAPAPVPTPTPTPAPTPTPVEAGEWTTARLPEKSGYRVETKEQYRSRTQERTESAQSSLPGWTLYDTKTTSAWGEWSGWKDGNIFNAGDSVQVETRQAAGRTTTYYNLYYYKYWNGGAGAWYYTYAPTGTKYTARAPASECVPYQSFDGYQAYTYNGFNLWWVESTDSVTVQNPQYRTRSKTQTTTYYYYRWSDWSRWQDTFLSSGGGVEVETQTLYRYVPEG